MIYEMTMQFRVSNINEGQAWYECLFQRKPDFIPHDGFAEWELIPGSWLQVAEGTPTPGNGPLRLGVTDIEAVRTRIINELGADHFEIHSREEVPVKWGTFSDPWGNRIGFFETLNKEEMNERIQTVLNK